LLAIAGLLVFSSDGVGATTLGKNPFANFDNGKGTIGDEVHGLIALIFFGN